MTHPSADDLALLVGDELPAPEAARIEAHVTLCPDCRAVVADFRRQAQAVRAAVQALPAPALPFPHRVQARRSWLPLTAAAAVLAILLMGAAVPAVAAAVVRFFSFVNLHELTPQETAEEARALSVPRQGGACADYSDRVDAEAAWGGKSVQPGYLPQGFAPKRYTPCQVWFTTEYRDDAGHWFTITQGPTGGDMKVPQGAATDVEVNGRPALLLRGNWVGIYLGGSGPAYNWDPESGVSLLFEHNGKKFSIHRISTSIEVKEMIRIAESFR